MSRYSLAIVFLLSGLFNLIGTGAAIAGTKTQFPVGFRWCVATSAYQIEGGNSSTDWWKWEKDRGLEPSGIAVDHWNRSQADLNLLSDLNVTDYRLSVEWSRVEPEQGRYNWQAIAQYKKEIDSLSERGIRPVITLQHFTLPQWVREKGGFEWADLPNAFAQYSVLVSNEIAPRVNDYVTVNEPSITLMMGYLAGIHPPGEKREFPKILSVLRGLLTTHAAAYHALHASAAQRGIKIRVGVAHHLRTMDAYSKWNPMDQMIATVGHAGWNWAIPDALETGRLQLKLVSFVDYGEVIPDLKGTQDFLAVNYYSGDLLRFTPTGGFEHKNDEALAKTDLGWPIYPEGLYRLLVEASARYPKLSILITENGIADQADRQRPEFLKEHLRAVHRALANGAKVEGYCYWSLLDNFEWNEGFTPRFGLYEVDRNTMNRTPRPSAELYKSIIKQNGF